MSKSYKQAGIDLNAGYEVVDRIKKHAIKTKRKGLLGNIGSFGAFFDLSQLDYKNPVLVSGTDGVGTKLLIAQKVNQHDTIGIDCVAMCVNDILASGAEPLYFLDYLALGKTNPDVVESIVKGIVDGCQQAGCALIGGETAEMPDMYQKDEYDIAGFSVGIVEKQSIIDGSKINVGDVLIGLPSSGVHSNGFSLVRKILMKDLNVSLDTALEGKLLKDVLLTPTRIYVKPVLSLIKQVDVLGISHITGGGFIENIPRMLPQNLGVEINASSFPKLPIFDFLEKKGHIDHLEMYNIFNMGIGMVLVVKKEDVKKTIDYLENLNEAAYEIGVVTNTEGVVIL